MTDLDVQDKENFTLIGVSRNGEITYNLVENETDFKNTGLSVIRRLRDDKNQFIADMYIAQNYLSIDRIFDDNIIYSTKEKLKDNTNITTYENIIELLKNEENLIDSMYIYDISEDVLIIKIAEIKDIENDFIGINYKDLSSVKRFIEEYDIDAYI